MGLLGDCIRLNLARKRKSPHTVTSPYVRSATFCSDWLWSKLEGSVFNTVFYSLKVLFVRTHPVHWPMWASPMQNMSSYRQNYTSKWSDCIGALCGIRFGKAAINTHLHSSPEQFFPVPVKPGLQAHVYEPGVLPHVAFESQGAVWHSYMSATKMTIQYRVENC